MNALLTGGAGYIGSVLAQALLRRGHKVTIVDLGLYQPARRLAADDALFFREDIRTFQWEKVLKNHTDVVIDLAGLSIDVGCGVSEATGYAINYEAHVRLFDKCREFGVGRFIFPSSCSVYGNRTESGELDETCCVDPLSDYARLKFKFEQYVTGKPEIDYVIVRPATVYGYSARQRFDLLVNQMTVKTLHQENVFTPNQDAIRPSVYLRDLVKAYLLFAEAPYPIRDLFNVASENRTVKSLFQMLKARFSSASELREIPGDAPRSYRVSSQKLLTAFPGFRFTPLETGVDEFSAHIMRGEFLDYKRNSNYYNALRQAEFFGRGTEHGRTH